MTTKQPLVAALAFFGVIACSDSSFKGNSAAHVISGNPNAGQSGDGKGSDDPSKNGGGAGNGAGSGSGNTAGSGGNGKNVLPPPPPPPNINFGMMVGNLDCTFCHLEVHGTVVSVGDVPPLRADSHGRVFGKWLVTGDYHGSDQLANVDGGIVVDDKIVPKYSNSGKEVPINKSGAPAFPALDFAKLAASMQGSIAAPAAPSSVASISKVQSGNVVLIGTPAQPLVINRDILVEGDVVIKGVYTGVGTIYATGNIYIPANLKAVHLASFPYSDTAATANTQALADLKAGNKDALGLASAKSIFIGDLENYMDARNSLSTTVPAGAHGARYNSIYTSADANDPMSELANGVWNLYNWLPELQYEKFYENGTACFASSNSPLVSGHKWGERVFSQIDAYLYAGDVIGGVDRAATWTINGGMISQAMHIVSAAGSDSVAAVDAAGKPVDCGASRINFDYRMQNGLQVLEQLGALIPTK